MTDRCLFRLKVQQIEKTCSFDLYWGGGQQLSCSVNYPQSLTRLYQEWQRIYLSFYKSGLRGRVEDSGSIAPPPIDWHARLVQAEAKLLYEFHYWLRSEELYDIRTTIASEAKSKASSTPFVDVLLTCQPIELARLPWEVWEIGAESGTDAKAIRIMRLPGTIRESNKVQSTVRDRYRQGKVRILAVLGDDTGLNLAADQTAIRHCARVAEIEFVSLQPQQSIAELKANICNALVDERGWDVLLFAGHSNETERTGGEVAIAPNACLSIQEISPQLQTAKERGLQFAFFNSCSGINIAESLIDLGLSQVLVMREPIRNDVAQDFLLKFLQGLAEHKDVHAAMLRACQYLKLEKDFQYPSADLIPSLFCHPEAVLFHLPPNGVLEKLKRLLPTRREAIALSALTFISLLFPVQDFLIEKRVLTQAVYRQVTKQIPTVTTPPVLLVQIDEKSINKARIANPRPMDRQYLARLVDQLSAMNARVMGIDYLFDRPHTENSDHTLAKSVQTAVQKPTPTWFVFASIRDDAEGWLTVLPEIASPNWSLQGDIHLPHWYMPLLPQEMSTSEKLPFAYLLAMANQVTTSSAVVSQRKIDPNTQNQKDFLLQITRYLQSSKKQDYKTVFSPQSQLQPITRFSYHWHQMWLHPIIDFSLPPDKIYSRLPAWKVLSNSVDTPQLQHLQEQVIIVAPGGYDEAGIATNGQDNYPLPAAFDYWVNQINSQQRTRFTGGEAHAYITHHFLNRRFVVPIPDLWMIGLAALLGKGAILTFLQQQRDRRWGIVLLGTTAIYGLASLQLYISVGVLLPCIFPALTFWLYVFPIFLRKNKSD